MIKRLTVLYALLSCAPLFAQPDTLKDVRWLSPVVVVANKTPTALAEIGKATWAADTDALNTSMHLDWAQRVLEAGVVVGGAFSNLSKNKEFFYRGASSRYMVTLIDGTPIIDPSAVGESAYDLRMFSPNEANRLELLKGGYGALYGANVVAGALNFITDEALPSTPLAAEGSFSAGSFGTWQPQLEASGQVRTQGKWRWGYKITASYVQSDGISEAQPPNDEPVLDKDGFSRLTYSLSVPVEVGEQLRIRPYFRHSRLTADTDQGSFVENNSQYHSRFGMGGLDANWNARTPQAPNFVFKYAYQGFYSKFSASTNFEYPGRFQYTEAYAFGKVGAHIRWLGGLDFRQKYQEDRIPNPPITRTSNSLNPYATLDVDKIAGAPLHIQLGGRLNWHSAYGTHLTYHLNPYFVFQNNWKLHATYATSFRPPDLYSLSLNENLMPEEGTNIALGLSALPIEPQAELRLVADISFFRRDIKHIITFLSTNAPPYTYPINVQRQRDYGMEFAPVLYGQHWEVRAMYAYTNGHLVRDKDNRRVRIYNLIRRPRHAYQFSGQLQLLEERLGVRLQLQGYGERIDRYFRSTPPYGNEEVRLKPYALLHAYIHYSLLAGRLKLFVEGRNLTHNTNYTDIYGYTPLGFNGYLGLQFALKR